MRVEEEHTDVLQNMEGVIVALHREDAALVDHDVLDAIEALTRHYTAEQRKRNPPFLRLGARPQEIYEAVKAVCEWRLGRQSLAGMEDIEMKPLPIGVLIACLKRIRRSIRLWHREGGRKGYLEYVEQFIV